jgi:ubiquitin carboxyl-terminal hydrolase 14
MVKIKLKWNKEVYSAVELDTTQGVAVFKEAVYKLTAVPTDRQKLMAKGGWTGTLKDEADLSSMTIKEGQQVLLMGSAEVVAAPKEAVKFVEDMTVEEQALKGAIIPAGLVNLGNTCYMNSTVECLRMMPELREALKQAQSINLATLLRATYDELDKAGSSIPPYSFVYHLRTNFPQFAEQTPQGRWMQQDAEEFYNTLTNAVQREVDRTSTPFCSLLGLSLEEQITCNESDLETSTSRSEAVNKIVCNIQGGSGASTNIDHMHEGLKLGLEGTLEKFSTVLERNAIWSRKQRIASLPRYICVQFMRFFWKTTPESRDHTGLKCKILRAVTFPEVKTVWELGSMGA